MRKAKNDPLSYLNIDFYHVEKDRNGKNWIHSNGYVYFAGDGDLNENGEVMEYRMVEYAGLYLDPDEMREWGYDYYDSEQGASTQYIGDATEREAIEYILELLKGAKPLPMSKVTNATPEGWYYANPKE